MPRSLYEPLVRILMLLQWASAASIIVACWIKDQAPTNLHYCLLLSATVCVLMSFGAHTAPQRSCDRESAR